MRNAKSLNTEQRERAATAQPPEAWPQQRRDSEAASGASDASSWAGDSTCHAPTGFCTPEQTWDLLLFPSRASGKWLMPGTRFTRIAG